MDTTCDSCMEEINSTFKEGVAGALNAVLHIFAEHKDIPDNKGRKHSCNEVKKIRAKVISLLNEYSL